MNEKRCYGCMQLRTGEGSVCEHCGYDNQTENAIHQLPAGTVLKGQYLIGRVLGQGGFGITYLGWDQYLNIPLAIKEYYPSGTVMRDSSMSTRVTCYETDPDSSFAANRDRFLREAQTLARLSNVTEVVQVKNFFLENNTAYIVMEYVQGTNLRTYVQSRDGRLSGQETLSILKPIIGALQKVHQAGLIHRDISPDNIMLLPGGGVKLLDFGAVRDVGNIAPGEDAAKSTVAILKQGFAPIEQYQRRGSMGPWTDVYALCATAYYCMTGDIPTDAPERLIGDDRLAFNNLPGLSPRQAQALERGMMLQAKQRTASMEELYHELFDGMPAAPRAAAPAAGYFAATQPVQAPVPPSGYYTATQPVQAPVPPAAPAGYPNGMGQQNGYPTGMGYNAPAAPAAGQNARGYAGTLPLEMHGTEHVTGGSRPYGSTLPLEMPGDDFRSAPTPGYPTGMGVPGGYRTPPANQPVPTGYPNQGGQNNGYYTVAFAESGGFTTPVNPQTGNFAPNPQTGGYTAPVTPQSGSYTAPVTPGDVPEKKKKKSPIALIAAIVAVIALAVGGFLLFGGNTNYAETNILMEDCVYVDYENPDEAYNAPVFGNDDLRRRDIINVFFVDNLKDVENGWDVSAAGNGAVMAEAVPNGDGTYDLYIGAKKGVWTGENLNGMFAGYCNLLNISFGKGNLHTENATGMRAMFEYCTSLRKLDLSTFDTSGVTDMAFLFNRCHSLQSVDLSSFHTAGVTDMSYMFMECKSLTGVDLSSFDTSSVTDMQAMFDYCVVLETLDLSNFNTSNVTDMGWMFDECNALTYLDVSSFDTSRVTNMYAMFANCLVLEKLDVSNFNTRCVTNMAYMFFGCESVLELDVSNFNTREVTDMQDMFGWCCSVRRLDVSRWDTGKVTDMSWMFYCCESLVEVPAVENFNTIWVKDYENFMDPGVKVNGRSWINLF